MIDALTKGIGAELGRPLRIHYYQTKRHVENNDKFKRSKDHIRISLIDILALSLFHHEIILPFYGASNFQSGARKAGVSAVRLGNQTLDETFYKQAYKVQKTFFAIVDSYGLPVQQLHVSNVSDFVDRWVAHLEFRDG